MHRKNYRDNRTLAGSNSKSTWARPKSKLVPSAASLQAYEEGAGRQTTVMAGRLHFQGLSKRMAFFS
jgi:hypothetical protein